MKVPTRAVQLILFISISGLIGSWSPCATAQEAKEAPKETPKETKKNVVNFEDQLVEGQTQKPELFYLLQQKNPNFKRLIRLRENFLPEMKATAEEMGRNGRASKNPDPGQ